MNEGMNKKIICLDIFQASCGSFKSSNNTLTILELSPYMFCHDITYVHSLASRLH